MTKNANIWPDHCPFCGAENLGLDEDDGLWAICCLNCGAYGPFMESKRGAAAWFKVIATFALKGMGVDHTNYQAVDEYRERIFRMWEDVHFCNTVFPAVMYGLPPEVDEFVANVCQETGGVDD